MKNSKIICTVFFVCALLFCLSSCAQQKDVTIAENNEAKIVIITKENEEDSLNIASKTLRDKIKEKEGLDKLVIANDAKPEYTDFTEVLIGNTNRTQSQETVKDLLYDDYVIGYKDSKLVIAGGSDKATEAAIDYFVEHYSELVENSRFSQSKNIFYQKEYPSESINIAGTDISDFQIVYPESKGKYTENFTPEKYSAQRLCDMIIDETGKELEITTEVSDKAIVINPVSENANEYKIDVSGDKIEISAGGTYAYTRAFDELFSNRDGNKIIVPDGYKSENGEVLSADTEKDFVYISNINEPPVKSLLIGENDISKYTIIHHDYGDDYTGYSENEIHAAQDLAKYIEYATGVKLEVKNDSQSASEFEILVGQTNREGKEIKEIDRSAYGDEALLIKTEGNRLIITGGIERGTLYGVYTLLEKYMGFRFYAEDCEVIYKSDKIEIPSDIYDEEIPKIEFRDVCQKVLMPSDIAAKRKINSFYQRKFSYAEGDSMAYVLGNQGFVHTMGTVYSLSNVDRQPCLSNEDIYQKTLKSAKAYLNSYKEAEIIAISQNDNNNHCTCSKCMTVYKEEGSHAGPLIRFINRLADDIKDEYPDVKILTLAYMYSADPPKTAPRDNVIIQLCSLDACNNHALSDASCDANKYFREQIKDWNKLTDNLYIWYYCVEFTGDDKNTPYMNFESLYDTYQMFYLNGVKGVFNEGRLSGDSTEFGALRAYLLSKLMWDTDMTREDYYRCIDEFIDAYYGEASEIIREYFNLMTEISRGKHFTQYAAAKGILDFDKLAPMAQEVRIWWQKVSGFDYSTSASKGHVEQLRTGAKFILNKVGSK